MPLPSANSQWPPLSVAPMLPKMAEWAAWYSGEPSRIIDMYAAQSGVGTSSSTSVPWWRFWSRARAGADGYQRALLHVPVASDLAAISGSLLFGEPPKIRVRPDEEKVAAEQAAEAEAKSAQKRIDNPFVETTTDDVATVQEQDEARLAPKSTPEGKAEKRLLQIAEEGDLYARLVEAAESSAAIGGVYIYPVWDTDLRGVPLLGIAQADMAVPTFKWGFLQAVTFHRVTRREGSRVWRHLEVHEVEGTGESRKAVVLHALYDGNETNLGVLASLDSDPETAGLEPRIELPFPELDVEYVPNIRPNRLWRASGHGVADIQGSETLLDALDETYASWMRDVRLAKARIIVPSEYLRPDPEGKPSFDIDHEIYTPMEMEPGLTQDARAMLAHQFQIRWMEHSKTAADLVERIVSNAGYTPSTLGATGDLSGAGTALRISEHKTLLTLRKKGGWWRTAIANVLYHMMLIDAEVFGSGIKAIRPTVLTSDSIIDNPLELAQTALAMKSAEAASTETRVRLLHPDWSSAEVAQEVERIKGDAKAAMPMAPQVGAMGNPNEDPASGAAKIPVTGQQKEAGNPGNQAPKPNAAPPK